MHHGKRPVYSIIRNVHVNMYALVLPLSLFNIWYIFREVSSFILRHLIYNASLETFDGKRNNEENISLKT